MWCEMCGHELAFAADGDPLLCLECHRVARPGSQPDPDDARDRAIDREAGVL